jgi:NAD(P)-dependent dehydrogenase (short-subunit alcohol dehydrogenase family)
MAHRSLVDSVVVITGASSGIGRAAARLFAQRGAAVVLAARREEALLEAAAECESLGGRALAVPTDVADLEAVEELARRAIEHFGGFDVWVNNASVTMFSRFEEAPPEANRRVIDTNLLGTMHGAQAALPHFRERGSGVLINTSSGFGLVGSPYQGAYTASKFAQRGLGQALRGEVLGTDIHVCTIMPGPVDTPLYRYAGNYIGRAAGPYGPIISPEKVARKIVGCAERPRREIVVGNSVRNLELMHALSPALYERTIARVVQKGFLRDEPGETGPGNLFEPDPEWTGTDGGFNEETKHRAVGVARHGARYAASASAALATALLGWLLLRKGGALRR